MKNLLAKGIQTRDIAKDVSECIIEKNKESTF